MIIKVTSWQITVFNIYVCQLSIVLREGLTFDKSTAEGLVINIKLKTVCYFLITITVYSVQRQR